MSIGLLMALWSSSAAMVAILGLGRAVKQVVPSDGKTEVRLMMPVALSYDHRIIDGREAVLSLGYVDQGVQEGAKLVLDGRKFKAEGHEKGFFLGASLFGVPVSTSQVVSAAIIGVGAAERASKVRWSVAEEIVTSWLITIPASGIIAAGVYWLMESLGG